MHYRAPWLQWRPCVSTWCRRFSLWMRDHTVALSVMLCVFALVAFEKPWRAVQLSPQRWTISFPRGSAVLLVLLVVLFADV